MGKHPYTNAEWNMIYRLSNLLKRILGIRSEVLDSIIAKALLLREKDDE